MTWLESIPHHYTTNSAHLTFFQFSFWGHFLQQPNSESPPIVNTASLGLEQHGVCWVCGKMVRWGSEEEAWGEGDGHLQASGCWPSGCCRRQCPAWGAAWGQMSPGIPWEPAEKDTTATTTSSHLYHILSLCLSSWRRRVRKILKVHLTETPQ